MTTLRDDDITTWPTMASPALADPDTTDGGDVDSSDGSDGDQSGDPT